MEKQGDGVIKHYLFPMLYLILKTTVGFRWSSSVLSLVSVWGWNLDPIRVGGFLQNTPSGDCVHSCPTLWACTAILYKDVGLLVRTA